MPWTNRRLSLYHGTVDIHVSSIMNGVQLQFSRTNLDFGLGFYTTTDEAQARRWADVKSRQARVPVQPALIRFTVERDSVAALDTLWFVRGRRNADDFWDLVSYCRNGGAGHQRAVNQGLYDMIIGPVANDWRRRKIRPDHDQVAFHTDRALRILNQNQPQVMP